VSFVPLSVCQNVPSSSEPSFCPLLRLAHLQWVSISLGTSVVCSDPLPSTFVPSSRHPCLQPCLHPSISITMLPASILALHGHSLVLQRALYLSYSKVNLPRAFISPQNTFTLSSTTSDASVWSSVPQDIHPPFGSLPEFLIVSAIPRLDARLHSSCSRHNASRDGPHAPRQPLSSAALFVSPQFRSVHCRNTLRSFVSCPLAASWRHCQSLWPPQDRSDPCDNASRSTRLFFKAIFVPQSGIFLSYHMLLFGSWRRKDVRRRLLSPLWFFRESNSLHLFLSTHLPWRFLLSFAIYFSSIYLGVSRATFVQFLMFLIFPLFFFPFSVLWNSPSCLKGASQRDLQSSSELSAVDSK